MHFIYQETSYMRFCSENCDEQTRSCINVSTQVGVVGIVRRTKPAVAYVVYSLDDMTGPSLDVKQWMDLEAANMNDRVIPPGTYIKVVGSLRSFENHRSMVAVSVRRVEDYNEITSHMMEVVQANLLNDGSSCSVVSVTSGVECWPFASKAKSLTVTTIMSLSSSNKSTSYGFTANQSQVGQNPQSPQHDFRLVCVSFFVSFCSRTCLKFLINEGHIFSTVDDDHFKSTYILFNINDELT
uniref:OB domain-containing protein n=1 Tax=Pygocentrus nattereri TaxID=42514 RepID=A0A3B4E757_PYGNA